MSSLLTKGNFMVDTSLMVSRFTALGNDTRLAIYRWLLPFNPEGRSFGEIAQSLGLADATLAFHLKELSAVGLIQSHPEGRRVIYSVRVENVLELVEFLLQNCCASTSCGDDAIDQCIPRGEVQACETPVARKPAARSGRAAVISRK